MAILRRAGKMAHLGAWEMEIRDPHDLAANPLRWSDEVFRIHGYEPGSVTPSTTLLFERTAPEERARLAEALGQALAGGQAFVIEHGILRSDGERREVVEKVEVVLDRRGVPRRLVGAVQDVTERRRAEDALCAARADAERARCAAEEARSTAEEASRAKDRFLAFLSHELRTPLTPVLACLSMLERHERFDPPTRARLDMIRRNIEAETHLIDDLLDVTRLARGKIGLDRRPVRLREVIFHALEVCRPELEQRRLDLRLQLGHAAGLRIGADPERLQQVFWNLIQNAVKFTPDGGTITIRCGVEKQEVWAEVADTGEGIEPDLVGRIFDAFVQAEGSSSQKHGGLGLGLAICRTLVELHGGTITARSEGRGHGATFRVGLPSVAAEGREASRPRPGRPQKVASRTILVVEDHADTAWAMQQVLKGVGHKVDTVGSVAAAVELAGRRDFDLLISDLGLPDASGLELLRLLRAEGRLMPAIAISGYGREEDIEGSRAAGFQEYLIKPLTPEQLCAAVARNCAGLGTEGRPRT